MRKLAARVAAGAALLAVGVGCSAQPGGTGAAGAPRDGGTLRLATEKEPECLDPHQSPTESGRMLTRPLVDSLVYQDSRGGLHPWLAARWTVSDDRRTYTFHLREDVTFTNGEKFDARAVVANLDHVVAPATRSLLASSLIGAYDSSRAVDAHTVEVMLESPDSGFLGALATPNLGMQAPGTLKGSPSALCARVIGTGPYRSDAGLVPQKGIDYVKNPDYAWGPEGARHSGPARLDRIEVRIVPDGPARLGALTSGQVDAVTDLSPMDVRRINNTPGFTLESRPYPGVNFSYWPNTAEGPLSDPNVRKALRNGIDWAQIVKNVYFGVHDPAKGVLASTTPGYAEPPAAVYAHDPAGAARLLDQAGWAGRDAEGYRTKNGKRLTLEHLWSDGSIADLAVQAQSAAKRLGIEIIERNVDSGTYVKRLLAGDYDLLDTSFSHPGPDVLRVMFSSANIPTVERGVSNNLARYDNPAVKSAFDRALKADDQATAFRVYGEVQRLVADDAAVFPIYSPLSTLASHERVQQVGFSADGTPDFYGVWLTS